MCVAAGGRPASSPRRSGDLSLGQRIVDLEYGPGVVVARDAAPNWVMLTFDQEKQVMFRAHVSRLRAERVALRVIPGGKADLQNAAAAA